MRIIVALAALTASTMAVAQTTTDAGPSSAPAAASAAARLSADSTIEAILAVPAGKAVIDRELPALGKHPAFEQIKGLSPRQLQPYSNGVIDDAKLTAIDTALKAIDPATGA